MLTSTEYEMQLEGLAEDCISNGQQPAKYLEQLLNSNNNSAAQLFEFRRYFIDQHDFTSVEGYLCLGFYNNKCKEDRVTFFCLELELETAIRRIQLINLCKKYDEKQTLFIEQPSLIEHIRIKGSKKKKPENELMDYSVFKQINTSEIMKFDNGFVKLCPYLNPKIPDWASDTFPYCPLFVRVNPDVFSDKRLPQLLTEELKINPYNIEWECFKYNDNLFIPDEYKLEDVELSEETRREYWERNVRKIKSLQISTSKKGNYRSFMLEELIDRNADEEILIGRCIHFDIKNFGTTDLIHQTLDHLDLAINVYEKKTRKIRLDESLAKGQIVDADYRTHVFRIDNITLQALPVFCLLFFGSMTLTERYLKNISIAQ